VRALTAPQLTEDALIASLRDALGRPPRALRVGIGDDAAVWKTPGSHLTVLTTDMLVDGVHFRSHATSPEDLGVKSLAVNLSDIAAMGARPAVAVIALGITEEVDADWLRRLYRGMASLANSSQCAIAGGDVVRAPVLTIGVTIAGHVRPSRLRVRSGAKPGDVIAVTGSLGRAAAGLRVLDRQLADALESGDRATVCDAYLRPTPRLREGAFLGGSTAVHAMMDISDGLSTDVGRMAFASGVDAVVDIRLLTLDPAVRAAAKLTGDDALRLTFDGGDDYELLIAIRRRSFTQVARGLHGRCGTALRAIGAFEKGSGAVWSVDDSGRRPLPPRGYDHLSQRA
jgi:thiamine-monophosphate kinase